MESMQQFLRDCLKDVDLQTTTTADLRKMYEETTGLTRLSKEDKKLFLEAVKTVLDSFLLSEDKTSIETTLHTKQEDINITVDEVFEELNSDCKDINSDTSDDFPPENLTESSFTDKVAKKINDRKVKIDSSDLDSEPLESVKDIKIRISPISSANKKQRAKKKFSSSEEDSEDSLKIPSKIINTKKDIQQITSDDDSLELPAHRNGLINRHKKPHVSSSSESDSNFLQDENNSFQTNTPKGKKRKLSSSNKELGKFSLDRNKSENNHKSRLSKRKVMGSSDSENEAAARPLKKVNRSNTSNMSKKRSPVQNMSESEDEPLTNFSKQISENSSDSENETIAIISTEKSNEQTDKNLSESEDEPLIHFSKQESSGSEDEQVAKLGRNLIQSEDETPTKSKVKRIIISSDSEDKPVIKIVKKNAKKITNAKDKSLQKLTGEKDIDLSDSDDECLEELLLGPDNKLSDKNSPVKENNSSQSSSSSADENEESVLKNQKNKQPKKAKEADSVKEKKRPTASENKIDHLKKYVRAAGIRVQSYTKLFENCKSMKAKSEKLMNLLEKEGLKGRPTLEKCKKLKKKIEEKKEIAELDLSNILKTEGRRPKRSVCSDATNYKKGVEESPTPVKRFSRLRDIVDSEGSD